MGVKTGYLAKYKEYPENEEKILVMRNRGNDELAPSEKLLEMWKEGEIDWEEYKVYFKEEMRKKESQKRIREIATKVRNGKDIRLICFEKNPPCHRFILEEMIKERLEK